MNDVRGSRVSSFLVVMMAVALAAIVAIWLAGSRNPFTPAGYVGYLTQGAIMGRAQFHGMQVGPTSPGRTWLVRVTNVSVTPYTYHEDFSGENAVLSRDNLRIAFRVHVVWRVKPDRVKDLVEDFSTLTRGDNSNEIVEVAYGNFLREPLRTFARDEVQKLDGLQIKNEITPVGERVLARVTALTANTPFEVRSVVVGNIQYPAEVANAVAQKLASTQILERTQIEIEIERRQKEKRIVQAEGIARSMEIINAKLSSQYLQHEAIEAQKAMVGSPNHTTVYIPVGPMGVPLVSTVN